MSENKTTKLITAGRDKKWTNGVVNPPVQRASTVVFNSVEEKRKATINRANKTLFTDVVEPTLISLSKMLWLKWKAALAVHSTLVVRPPFLMPSSLL